MEVSYGRRVSGCSVVFLEGVARGPSLKAPKPCNLVAERKLARCIDIGSVP